MRLRGRRRLEGLTDGPPAGDGRHRRAPVGTRLLLAACCVYLGLAGIYLFRTPAWENNDEAAHVQYVEYILTHHWAMPRITVANGGESHQAPLYYYLAAVWQRALGIPAFSPSLSPARGALAGKVYMVSHRYSPTQARQARWLHELRLISTLCGLITVGAAFRAGYLLAGEPWLAGAVGATAALWPKLLVVDAAVSNSALATAECATGLALLLSWRVRQTTTRALWSGAILGAAVVTDIDTIPIVVALALLFTWYGWRGGRPRLTFLVPGVAAIGSSWLFIRNYLLYGSALATHQTDAYLERLIPGLIRPHPGLSWHALAFSYPVLLHSFWFDAGWNEVQLPGGVDVAIWLCAGGCTVLALSRLRHVGPVVAVVLGSVGSWLALVMTTTQAQGRYLLLAATAWALLLVYGVVARAPDRLRLLALTFWPAVLAALDGLVLARYLIPYGGL